MKASDEKIFVTLKELSDRYSMPLSTLRRWASERRFPLYRISNRVRVSQSEFEEWFSQYKINVRGDKNNV